MTNPARRVGAAPVQAVPGTAPDRTHPSPAAPVVTMLLGLQAAAGNAATAAWLQRQPAADKGQKAGPEAPGDGASSVEEQTTGKVYGQGDTFDGMIKTTLSERDWLYHTLSNVTDKERSVILKIRNAGQTLLSLDTQYERQGAEPDRWWGALFVQSGQTEEVRNGLPPHSSLHLKLYGEMDHTKPDATRVEGLVSVRPA